MWIFTIIKKKKGAVVDSKKNTLVQRGEVPKFSLLIRRPTASVSSFGLFHVLFLVQDECDMNSNRH